MGGKSVGFDVATESAPVQIYLLCGWVEVRCRWEDKAKDV